MNAVLRISVVLFLIGHMFCWVAMFYAGAEFLLGFGRSSSIMLIAQELFSSPGIVALIFTSLCLDRATKTIQSLRSGEFLLKDSSERRDGVIRSQQWVSGCLAWGAGASCVLIVSSVPATVVLILSLIIFGAPMWVVEQRLTQVTRTTAVEGP